MADGQRRALGSGSTPDAAALYVKYFLDGTCHEMGAFLLSYFVVG